MFWLITRKKDATNDAHGPARKIVPSSLADYLGIMSKAVVQFGMSWKVIEDK